MEKKKRRYDAVIFDLDGTLLDTLTDLTASANAAAARFGFPLRTEAEICSFVGNGIRRLMQQVVPGGEAHPDFTAAYDYFRQHYGVHCMDETEPYPGILSLLDALKHDGIRTAIVSNKADFAVKKLSSVYFREMIDTAVGEHEGCRRKPAPDSVLRALETLGVPRSRAVYVGDSDVDLLTAQNAEMDCIPVCWGFRTRDFLIGHGADPASIAANVRELKEQLYR